MRKTNVIYKLIWILIIVALWEASSRLEIISPYILPPFTAILRNLLRELGAGVLPLQVLNSVKVVALGFAVSILASIVISALCVASKIVESFFMTLCTVLNPLPGVALLPIFMLWFGIGNGVLMALIFHGVAWPLITNLLTAFSSVPRMYLEWAENIECSFPNRLYHIYFFHAVPFFLSGVRIGWGRAWRALISGEMIFGMIGTLGGLGYYIYKARSYGRMEDVFAGIIIIILIGLFVENVLFKVVERHTVDKWGVSIGK